MTMSAEDPKKKVELRAGPIDVRISNLRTAAVVADLEAAARAGGAVDLSLELEGGGRIEVRGSVDPEPLALDLEVTLSDIPLAVREER